MSGETAILGDLFSSESDIGGSEGEGGVGDEDDDDDRQERELKKLCAKWG